MSDDNKLQLAITLGLLKKNIANFSTAPNRLHKTGMEWELERQS